MLKKVGPNGSILTKRNKAALAWLLQFSLVAGVGFEGEREREGIDKNLVCELLRTLLQMLN